ncbi:MAG: TolC family protein [Acidobacteriota bacterium]
MSSRLRFLPSLLIGLAAAASSETLTLDQVLGSAAERPAVQAVAERANQAEEALRIERRRAFWPTVGADFTRTRRDRTLSLSTPIGDFPSGGRTGTSGALSVTQPLLDPARMLHGIPAARHDLDAAQASHERARRERAAEAAELFFDVLALDSRRRAVDAFVKSLGARLDEVSARVKAGRALERDRLLVQLALDDAEQSRLELDRRREVVTHALGRAVGSDAPVEPLFTVEIESTGATPVADDASLTRALETRRDLAALRARLAATDRRRAATWAELIPRLEARADWVRSSGDSTPQDDWVDASVRVTWQPFAAGTRKPRARALRAEERAIEAELREAMRGVAVQVREAVADHRIAAGELKAATTGVKAAQEAVRVTGERYRAGRDTVQDLLDAEAILRDRDGRRQVALLELARARVRYELATGELLG